MWRPAIIYAQLEKLNQEQSSRFTKLLDKLSRPDLEEMDYRNIASEFREFEDLGLLNVSRIQPSGRVIYAYISHPGEEAIKRLFEEIQRKLSA